MRNSFYGVENEFFKLSGAKPQSSKIPYIVVENFPKLGLLTAIRFLEWVSQNPKGLVSLPTGKTPEHFIKWTQYLLENWNNTNGKRILKKYGLATLKKPNLNQLSFVQIDEFYPINSEQHNSFYNYVNEFYIKGFGLNIDNCLLIKSDDIPLAGDKHFSEIFTNNKVDLSLRYREAKTLQEQLQQESIFAIDNWCTNYEAKIREKGGIGFFLGGIGPDGHIAFNTRGSDHNSTTRLTATNFETQAVAASDLGGIEVSKNRLVITIGLETITYNPQAVAIIFAAGEAKALQVKNALEKSPSNIYPATVLQKLKNARFYITKGAAILLEDSVEEYYKTGDWTDEKTERAIIDLCKKIGKYGHHLSLQDLQNDNYCKLIPNLSLESVKFVENRVIEKINKGMEHISNQVFYHTGPHHDDIMLGILPHVNRALRNETNKAVFSVLTSGFTAVTNNFVKDIILDTIEFLNEENIQMVKYPDFFEQGYKLKWDKDVYHYLNKVASGEPHERRRGLAHRFVRAIVSIYGSKNINELRSDLISCLEILNTSYDGQKNPPKIQKIKGMIREFEEELVWAHFGIQVENVHHLRLGFYTGDTFTEQPTRNRDVQPILEEFRRVKPSIISLAFDPEGSGPDTHYKVLEALAEAIRIWGQEEDISNLKIWGYRNVWYRFHPVEANVIVPVSLNALAILETAFTSCYLSQVEASFPSYMLDGKFSELTKRIWVEQLKLIQLVLGKNYFYENINSKIRSSHGLLFFKEMSVDEFLSQARELEKSTEGLIE